MVFGLCLLSVCLCELPILEVVYTFTRWNPYVIQNTPELKTQPLSRTHFLPERIHYTSLTSSPIGGDVPLYLIYYMCIIHWLVLLCLYLLPNQLAHHLSVPLSQTRTYTHTHTHTTPRYLAECTWCSPNRMS